MTWIILTMYLPIYLPTYYLPNYHPPTHLFFTSYILEFTYLDYLSSYNLPITYFIIL